MSEQTTFNYQHETDNGQTLKPKQAVGRPPMPFNTDQAAEFLVRLEAGEAMHDICASVHLPSYPTISRWRTEVPEFAARYARARELSAEGLEHRAMLAAMSATAETFQQSRLIVDTLKWAAAKRNPKTHGDRIDATITFNSGLAERLAGAVARAQGRIFDVEPEQDAIEGPSEVVPRAD